MFIPNNSEVKISCILFPTAITAGEQEEAGGGGEGQEDEGSKGEEREREEGKDKEEEHAARHDHW